MTNMWISRIYKSHPITFFRCSIFTIRQKLWYFLGKLKEKEWFIVFWSRSEAGSFPTTGERGVRRANRIYSTPTSFGPATLTSLPASPTVQTHYPPLLILFRWISQPLFPVMAHTHTHTSDMTSASIDSDCVCQLLADSMSCSPL